MPLTRPQPRRHIHTRAIDCKGYEREDGLWDIEACLIDSKTYSFDNRDRGGIRAGEAIHDMRIRMTVDADLVVRAVEAVADAAPFNPCREIVGDYQRIVGIKIGPGWIRDVKRELGGVQGCTHLTDLLLGPLATTAFQTVNPARQRRERPQDEGGRPALIDSCHALAADGPVVAIQWPEFHTGKDQSSS